MLASVVVGVFNDVVPAVTMESGNTKSGVEVAIVNGATVFPSMDVPVSVPLKLGREIKTCRFHFAAKRISSL